MDFIKSFDLTQLMFLTKYDKLFSKLYTAVSQDSMAS